MTEAHCCELHDWKTIGTVSTSNGMLTLVAPYYANALGEWWDRRLDTLWSNRPGNFEEVTLEQTTYSVAKPEGYADQQTALLVTCDNGVYDVEARFCDEYGDGHLTICELRIRLHYHDDDELDPDD